MPTEKQKLGTYGEKMVIKHCSCPKCKKKKTLTVLPTDFKCVDVICDFCGYLGQVKTKRTKNIDRIPSTLPAAAWQPQHERMQAGIYFPLFIVLVHEKTFSIFYLPVDFQAPEMFVERKELRPTAKRAGWKGFTIDLRKINRDAIVRLK